jgi:hypothetical protein
VLGSLVLVGVVLALVSVWDRPVQVDPRLTRG